MAKLSISSLQYQGARLSRTLKAYASGDPVKIMLRWKNRKIGAFVAKHILGPLYRIGR